MSLETMSSAPQEAIEEGESELALKREWKTRIEDKLKELSHHIEARSLDSFTAHDQVESATKFIEEFKASGVLFEGGGQSDKMQSLESALRKANGMTAPTNEVAPIDEKKQNGLVDALAEVHDHIRSLIASEEE